MLKDFENQFAVSGMEDMMRAFLQKKLLSVCDSVKIDKMGNLHAANFGDGPVITLITYMDEPGVILTQITDDGYLRFETVGRINPSYLVSKRVIFKHCIGIISLKAIHLTTKKEREIPVKASQLFIDIGAATKEEAKKMVEIGDYGVLDILYQEFGNGQVKGRSVAGRMGCVAVCEILSRNSGRNIHAIFAAQREIGARGILGLKTKAETDYTIVFEGISANCYMDKDSRSPESGKGPVLATSFPGGVIDPAVLTICKEVANKEEVSLRYDTIQKNVTLSTLSKTGWHHLVALAIPVRYMDSVSPVANKNDMDEMIRFTNRLIDFISKKEEA